MAAAWKDYEGQIFDLLKSHYPDSDVSLDVKLPGRLSKTDRQIDVLISGDIAGNKIRIVVDGKLFNKKVDVKAVDSFIGFVRDVGAHKGILVSQRGFTEAAIQRAYNDELDIELDILSFEELKAWQGFEAIPYREPNGALISAPFGWIIDGYRYPGTRSLAHIYQRGLTLDDAFSRGEVIYVNFWDRTLNHESLEDLFEIQKTNLEANLKNVRIAFLPTIKRTDARTKLRMVENTTYPEIEYAGFIEFDRFIFFCVLLCRKEFGAKNIRKLESVMTSALPLEVKVDETTGTVNFEAS